MNLISLFSGVGGFDLGAEKAGFSVVRANDNDPSLLTTYATQHPKTALMYEPIEKICWSYYKEGIVGIIGGPPCQSWSAAGSKKGINDPRGRLFFEFVRVISEVQPLFFIAENVPGLLAARHSRALSNIVSQLEGAGYLVTKTLLNANHYGVPQERKRLFVVGFRKDLYNRFDPEGIKKSSTKKTLRDAIGSMPPPVRALDKNKANPSVVVPNHEYFEGTYSSHYMSRDRVRDWDQPSFTIQASGRHAPMHPSCSHFIPVKKDVCKLDPNAPNPYRRLSVRECARIQTFPDSFKFFYEYVNDGYRMIGNAVPVELARRILVAIKEQLSLPAIR